jgi:hypothetical protein
MSHRLALSSLSLVVGLFGFGCAQGQTGGEIEYGEDANGGSRCADVSQREVTESEEVTEHALTLHDLVEQLDGEFEVDMSWLPNGSREDVVVTPEASPSSITVTILPVASSGKLLDREVEVNDDGTEEGTLNDGFAYYGGGCADRLTVDAQVTVHAANGAINDEFMATFWTEDGIVVQSSLAIEPGGLKGSFDVDVSALENGTAIQTNLDLALAFGALSGSLSGGIQTDDGEGASFGGIRYAVFPPTSACEAGFELPADDALRAEVQALFDAHKNYNFTWDGEATQLMQISTELVTLCYEGQYGSEPQLSGSVNATVQLADGSIEAHWPLSAFVSLNAEGRVDAVQVVRNNYFGDSFAPDAFAEEAGISGIESDADQLSFTFGYTLDQSDETQASGELTVLALTVADCVSGDPPPDEPQGSEEDPAEPEEGGGSPGCAGTTADEIKNAQFVAAVQ